MNNLRSLMIQLLRGFARGFTDRIIGMIFGIGVGAFIGIISGIFRVMPATGEFDIVNYAALFALMFGVVGLALGFENMKEFIKRVQWWD